MITRRDFARHLGSLGAALAAAPARWSPAAPPRRPNILLIISEDNGPDLGCYGDAQARTPCLDNMAAQGARFNRAFVTQAGCSPSRASVLTGLYPHQNGQIGLATWGFRMYRDDTPTLPGLLREADYRTARIGKLHVNPEQAFPYDIEEISSGNYERKNLGEYARLAEEFFTADERPFFLHINYPDAHDPFLAQVDGLPRQPQTGQDVKPLAHFGIDAPELRQLVADYYNCLSRLDTLIGDLLAALERSGKAADTLVIYMGDHGPDLMRGKRTCYEGGVRIPLILRWPRKVEAQSREDLVSTIDLMPTALEAAGVALPAGLPGLSLLPLMTGGNPEWRRHLFTEFHTHATVANFFPQRAVRDARYKLIENLLPDEVNPDSEKIDKEFPFVAAAVAAAPPEVREAYALMQKPPRYELYDLQSDPHEFRNLAGAPEHASAFANLKQRLAAWREETKDPLLSEVNLQRLKAEVYSVNKKSVGKEHEWGYPDYFFGKEPPVQRDTSPATEKPARKKKKQQAE